MIKYKKDMGSLLLAYPMSQVLTLPIIKATNV